MMNPRAAPRRLALYLALAWAGLAIYASLYPFAGWRDSGADPLAFLRAAWPRYYTAFDIGLNVAAYVPLGFFVFVALRHRANSGLALIVAASAGLVLSLSLEIAQNYLPSRVASNLDLACNSGGALLGALAGVRWGGLMLEHGRISRLRGRLFREWRGIDSGLILLGLWLVALLDPAVLSFGTGDLRHWLDLPVAQDFSAERFRTAETVVAASGALSGILLISLLAAPRQRRVLPLLLMVLALAIKTLAFALLFAPGHAFAWATPGTLSGLAVAMVLGFGSAHLVPHLQRALAAVTLLLATAVVNLAPHNPYLDHAIQVWNPGQFLNFHGLTQFIASLWPFLTLPWLMLLTTKEEQ